MRFDMSKITFVLIAALIVGMGYLFYSNYRLEELLLGARNAQPQVRAAATPDFGIGTSALYLPSGTVKSIRDGVLTLATMFGPGTSASTTGFPAQFSVRVTPSTEILLMEKTSKSPAVQASELAAHNAEVKELMRDPAANKTRLEYLLMPLLFETAPLALADIKVGNRLSVQSSGKNADGEYVALRVVKAPGSRE